MRRWLCLMFLLWVGAAGAAPSLRFAEEGAWPPFTLGKEGATREGLSWELIREIGRRAGFEVSLTLFPQKRLEHEVALGNYDGITVISRNAAREGFLEFSSEPLFQKLGYLYFRAGQVVEWRGYADLKGLRIGVARGHNLGPEFAEAVSQHALVIDEGNSDEQNFMKLVAGRVDVVFGNHWTAVYLLRQSRFAGLIERAKRPYFSKDYHVALSRKSVAAAGRMPAIDRAIRAMREEGALDALLVEHLNPERGAR